MYNFPYPPPVTPPTEVVSRQVKLTALKDQMIAISISSTATAEEKKIAEDMAIAVWSPIRHSTDAFAAELLLQRQFDFMDVSPDIVHSASAVVEAFKTEADSILSVAPPLVGARVAIAEAADTVYQQATNAKDAAVAAGQQAPKIIFAALGQAAKAVGEALPWYFWAVGGGVVLIALLYVLTPVRMAVREASQPFGGYTPRRLQGGRRWRKRP